MDGADTAGGLPDDFHSDNAFFIPLPDGTPGLDVDLPRRRVAGPFGPSPLFALSGSNDAETVYHEYTHGFTSRLVTDDEGFGALDHGARRRDGRGLERLVRVRQARPRGQPLRRPRRRRRPHWSATQTGDRDLFRTQPIDCPVGRPPNPRARARPTAGEGGYTFGDFGKVLGAPRGPRRRRDLGADAVAAARGAHRRARDGRGHRPRRAARDRRHAAVAAGAVVPRPAQRDPAGRRDRRARRPGRRHDLGGLRGARHGLVRRGRLGRATCASIEDFSLPPAPAAGEATIQGVVRDDAGHAMRGRRRRGQRTRHRPRARPVGDDRTRPARTRSSDVPAGTYPRVVALAPPGSLDGAAARDRSRPRAR